MESTIDQDQLRFAHPFSMILAGGRWTQKTHFTKILLERSDLISLPLETIVWYYRASFNSDTSQPTSGFLKHAYYAATNNPFSQLFIKMLSDALDALRYRSNVLDETQTVYQPV